MSKARKLTECAMFIATAIVFQLVEASVPLPFVIPGFKLGLANCVALVVLYRFDIKTMTMVNVLRVILASLIRGTLFQISFFLSFSGALLASVMMAIVYKWTSCSSYGVSIAGSTAHVIAQIIVIMMLYEQWRMIVMLPVLLILAIPTGIGVAMIANATLKRLR